MNILLIRHLLYQIFEMLKTQIIFEHLIQKVEFNLMNQKYYM